MSLFDFKMWILGSRRLYLTYTTELEALYAMKEDEAMNFVLLVWHSEGCPDI